MTKTTCPVCGGEAFRGHGSSLGPIWVCDAPCNGTTLHPGILYWSDLQEASRLRYLEKRIGPKQRGTIVSLLGADGKETLFADELAKMWQAIGEDFRLLPILRRKRHG